MVIQAKIKVPPLSPRWKRFEGTEEDARRLAEQVGELPQRFPEDAVRGRYRVSALERQVAADQLEEFVAKCKGDGIGDDEVYRFLRAQVCILTRAESERVMLGLANLLRAKT